MCRSRTGHKILIATLIWTLSAHLLLAQNYDDLLGAAKAAAASGQYASAIEQARRAIDANKTRWEAYVVAGVAYAKQLDCGNAFRYLSAAIPLAPQAQKSQIQLAINECQTKSASAPAGNRLGPPSGVPPNIQNPFPPNSQLGLQQRLISLVAGDFGGTSYTATFPQPCKFSYTRIIPQTPRGSTTYYVDLSGVEKVEPLSGEFSGGALFFIKGASITQTLTNGVTVSPQLGQGGIGVGVQVRSVAAMQDALNTLSQLIPMCSASRR
jgi:hypothetical protein